MISLFQTAWQANAGLRIGIWWNVGLLALGAAALPFDGRRILGISPWIKPIKFDLSVMIFLITVGALLAGLGRWQRSQFMIGWAIGLAMLVENTVISLQSLRGVRSHMNFDTALDSSLFAVMGLAIALSTVFVIWLLVLYCATPTDWPPAVAWGARLGLLTLVAGSLEGVYMVQHMSHTVGAADGLAGLPFVNWSTGHGDLRVAHFFALHALQVMPLIGFALTRTRLAEQAQLVGLCVGCVAYLGFIWALFAQAMSGRPLIS